VPRQIKENGLEGESDIVFSDAAVRLLIRRYTREAFHGTGQTAAGDVLANQAEARISFRHSKSK